MNITAKKIAALTLAASAAFLSACGQGIDSGTGKQIGTIVRMGQHGFMASTTEGELALQNFRGGGSNSTLHFTVVDKDVEKQLTKAMEDRTVVEVEWNKRTFSGPLTMESDHILTKVTEFNTESKGINPKMAAIEPQEDAQDKTAVTNGDVFFKCVPISGHTEPRLN